MKVNGSGLRVSWVSHRNLGVAREWTHTEKIGCDQCERSQSERHFISVGEHVDTGSKRLKWIIIALCKWFNLVRTED